MSLFYSIEAPKNINLKDFENFCLKKCMVKENIQHTFFSFKKDGIRITLYKTYKLVIQGKLAESFYIDVNQFLNFKNEKVLEIKNDIEFNPLGKEGYYIGSDESGKGDTFGPMCVSSVSMSNIDIDNVNPKIKDSKKISDIQIKKLASEIRSKYKYQDIVYSPKEYNKQYEVYKNVSLILFHMHVNAIKKLPNFESAKKIIIDKFPINKKLKDILFSEFKSLELKTHAESEIPVACASILARDRFITYMEEMSKEWGMEFAKGSVHVSKCIDMFIEKYGIDNLDSVSKIHFKNIKLK